MGKKKNVKYIQRATRTCICPSKYNVDSRYDFLLASVCNPAEKLTRTALSEVSEMVTTSKRRYWSLREHFGCLARATGSHMCPRWWRGKKKERFSNWQVQQCRMTKRSPRQRALEMRCHCFRGVSVPMDGDLDSSLLFWNKDRAMFLFSSLLNR